MRKIGRLCLLLVPAVVALAVIAPPAPADAGATITRQSVAGDTFACDGALFTVTAGTFKVVTKETLSPSGAYHLIVEGNAQAVKAVGPTGATYQVPGGFWIEVNVTPGATVTSDTGVLNVIGQGSAPDFTMHAVVHTTVDANGDVTADIDHFMAAGDCVVPPQP
jgi:hypothetical protein